MKIFRVKPGSRVRLNDYDPEGGSEMVDVKDEGLRQLELMKADIRNLQQKLYAERKHRLLVILQGLDGSGKDGTV